MQGEKSFGYVKYFILEIKLGIETLSDLEQLTVLN